MVATASLHGARLQDTDHIRSPCSFHTEMDKSNPVRRTLEKTEYAFRRWIAIVSLLLVLASDIVGLYSSFFCTFDTCRHYTAYVSIPSALDCNYQIQFKWFYNVSQCSPQNITLNCFEELYREDMCDADVGSIRAITNMTVYNCSGSLIFNDFFSTYTLVPEESNADGYCKKARWIFLASLFWNLIIGSRNIKTAYRLKHKVVSTLMILPSTTISVVAIVLSVIYGYNLKDRNTMIASKIASLIIMSMFYMKEMRTKHEVEEEALQLQEIQM